MNNETNVNVQYVSPLKKILMTIGELPTSYIETMSYYEMLVWFTEFLRNQVIPAVNNNAEAVQELQTLYLQLQEYVNNYFDNLDVQDEIDNKLEEMAESGQLTDIIAQYLGLAGMIAFDTVADMKIAENLVNGSKCYTLGYRTVNDEGKAIYKVRTVTNDDVVDEKSIIALHDNSLVAEIIKPSINAESFGCYGDNTHDDSSNLQSYINYCINNDLPVIANKNYLISSSIVIENISNKEININTLNYSGNSYALKIIGSSYNNIKIKNIISNYDGLLLEAHHENYKDVGYNNINIDIITANHNGIDFKCNDYGINYNKINFNMISAANICINCEKTSLDTGWISENVINGGRLKGLLNNNSNISVYCKDTQALKFYNIGIEGTVIGFSIEDSTGIIIENPRMIESISSYAIKLKGDVRRCIFNLNNLYLNQLDYSEITGGNTNIFKGTFRDNPTSGNEQQFTYFEIWGDKTMHNCNQKSRIYLNGRNANTTLTLGSHIKGFPSVVYINAYNLILDTKFYNTFNINELILFVGGPTDADNSKIYDENNNVIFDYSPYGYKTLHLKCINEQIDGKSHSKWLIEQVTLL